LHGEKHDRNLAATLFCLNHQTFRGFETIVVTDKIRHAYNKTRFYQAIDPKNNLMNKNWMFNIGANQSKGKKLVFLDADMVFHEDYLQKIHESNHLWAIGWSKCVYLETEISNQFRNLQIVNFFSETTRCSVFTPTILGACGGSQVFEREFFFKKFYGHNENYSGWGGEDNDSSLRASTLTGKINWIKFEIGHLNHELTGVHTQTRNNQDQWWKTEHNPSEVTRRIGKNRELGLVGCLDKPNHVEVEDLK